MSDSGELAGVCFTFNAWGGKYHPHDGDDAAAVLSIGADSPRLDAEILLGQVLDAADDGQRVVDAHTPVRVDKEL